MARRAAFIKQNRPDSLAVLLVDAGNFSPLTSYRADTLKLETLMDFFRYLQYDAVALGPRELAKGTTLWENAARAGLPIVATNLFADAQGKKPFFGKHGHWRIFKRHGVKVGVMSFVSESSWKKANLDSVCKATLRSPFAMGRLVHKLAKKCDYLIVTADFTQQEADSFARLFPEVALIATTAVYEATITRVGNVVISGVMPKAPNGQFVEWNPAAQESSEQIVSKVLPLDSKAPKDSVTAALVTAMNEKIRAAPPQKQ